MPKAARHHHRSTPISVTILFSVFLLFLAMDPLVVRSAGAAPPFTVPSDLVTTDVTFNGDGGDMFHGTVLAPKSAPAARPGIVLVHGSGSGTSRSKLLPEAIGFARQGLSVLIYDKRSEGYTAFRRSYGQLSRDVLGAVACLRAQRGVDPSKVGVWGISEGGWVAPLAATQSTDIAFVIVTGANAMVPVRQQAWSDTSALRRNGVSGSLTDRTAPTMYRLLADIGLFAEARYNAPFILEQLKQPLLAIWGTDDLSSPPGENPLLFEESLRAGGNDKYTFRFFPGADHAAHQTPDGGVTRLPLLAPGYAELIGTWTSQATSARAPGPDVATPPRQSWLSVPIPQLQTWESGGAQIATLLTFAFIFGGYLLRRLVQRTFRRTRGASGRRLTLILAILGFALPLATFVYLIFLFTDGAQDGAQGPVLLGRPVPWMLLQICALSALIVGAVVARNGHRGWPSLTVPDRIWLTLLLIGTTLLGLWSFYWGLLMP